MKKQSLLFLTVAVASLGACQKEAIKDSSDESRQILTTISANLPEKDNGENPDSKISFTPQSAGGLDLNWEDGDNLLVVGKTSSIFQIKEGFGPKDASFEGTEVTGDSFSILYPGFPSISDFEAFDFNSQEQDGNANLDHLEYFVAMKGVDSYKSFSFSPEWASQHGGSFYASAVIRFYLKLPAEISEINAVGISSDEELFFADNGGTKKTDRLSLSLKNVNVADDGQVLTAYMAVSGQEVALAGKTLTAAVYCADGSVYRKSFEPGEVTLCGGKEFKIQLNDQNWSAGAAFDGSGTETDPYIIVSPIQMCRMNTVLVDDQTVYFRLANDLDMSDIEWHTVVPEWSAKLISFDGGNHTISNLVSNASGEYSSIFGALAGTVKDLNIDSCTFEQQNSYPAGAVCAWAGTNASSNPKSATVENVHATNCTVLSNGTSAVPIGGLCSKAANATFKDCSFSGNVENHISGVGEGDAPTGAIVGTAYANCVFDGCSSEGVVVSDNVKFTAGIVGLVSDIADIRNCTSSADITGGTSIAAGIVGQIAGGTVSDCSYTGGTITTQLGSTSSKYGYVGGIVGMVGGLATIEGCSFSGEISAAGFTMNGGILAQSNTNVTIKNCSVTGTISSGSGVGGILGYVTAVSGADNIQITKCSTHDLTMSCAGADNVAAIMGYSNVFVQIYDCNAKATITGKKYVAGIIGAANASAAIGNCDATLTLTGTQQPAGIAGYIKGVTASQISGCTVSGTLEADDTYQYPCLAGIVSASANTLSISNCTNNASLRSNGSSTGGIYGQTNDNAVVTINKCLNTGTLTSAEKLSTYTAGILAYARNATSVTITECASTGGIYGCQRVGGILGYSNNTSSAKTVLVSDCFSTGTVRATNYSGTGGGYAGGIAGDIAKYGTIQNCWSSAALNGNFSSGGIVGRANNNANTEVAAKTAGGYGIVVDKCIAWNTEVRSTDNYKRHTSKGYSDGAIVGFTNIYNTLQDCWHKGEAAGGYNFRWYATQHGGGDWDDAANALPDQENASPSAALTNFPQGGTFDFCYNGKKSACAHLGAALAALDFDKSKWSYTATSDNPTLVFMGGGGGGGDDEHYLIDRNYTKTSPSIDSDLSKGIAGITAAMRITLTDSKHYAENEKITSLEFSTTDGSNVSGSIRKSDGVLETGYTYKKVTYQSSVVTALRVKGAGGIGLVTLPLNNVSGQFTVVTDRATYTFTRSGITVAADGTIDVTLDFCAPDVQPKRKVGVLGDSISTFTGWVANTAYSCEYPSNTRYAPDPDMATVDATYWHQVIFKKMKCGEFDKNSSWCGTRVITETKSGMGAGFIDRVGDFSNPDIILLHGGTNDLNQKTELGSYDYEKSISELDKTKFRSAFIAVIKELQSRYEGVQIIIIIGNRLGSDYGGSVVAIANHFGIPYVDFRSIWKDEYTLNGSHPNAKGMAFMADKIYEKCVDYLP